MLTSSGKNSKLQPTNKTKMVSKKTIKKVMLRHALELKIIQLNPKFRKTFKASKITNFKSRQKTNKTEKTTMIIFTV